MCGITGFMTRVDFSTPPENILQKMTDRLAHRGPNDQGVWCHSPLNSPSVGLGHRRLSILDLSTNGHQPMEWEEFVLSYNGEVYNYLELRRELVAKGYSFRTQTDSEVILVAYREWGIEAFKKFNGMWAIALYDRKRQNLLLSRDRFGKKPLYYHLSANSLVFGSEIKSLLEFPGTPRLPNYEKVYRYLSGNYRYVDTDSHSFFSEIEQVPKGTVCFISPEFKLEVSSYWSLSPELENSVDLPDERVINQFKDLFFDSVQLRLRSDVPVACFLSGGLDSTSITCVASKVFGKQIQTFSGVTGEGVYDESEYINAVVKEANTDHHYIRPDPVDLFATVKEMLQFHDEPVCTVTWYSIYLIAKKIAQFDIRVVLNGHGGDETCGGYWDYYQYHFWDLQQQRDPSLEAEITHWRNNHDRPLSEIEHYRNYIGNLEKHTQQESERFPNYDLVFSDEFRRQHSNKTRIENPYKRWLSKRMYSDLLFETVPPVLRAEDRNTMAFSIESRSPFLDYRIAELLFTLPNRFKIRGGLGKWLIRESMKGILPEEVRTRKDKAGFIAPFDSWVRTSQRKAFEQLIQSAEVQNRGIYNIPQLNALLDEHLSGSKNHAMFFWQFLNLELWFQTFFD